MNRIVWYLVLLLVIAHHDFWFWNRADIILGMPVGLVYHIGLSIVAAATWAFVCYFAWPKELEGYDQDKEVAE